MILRAFSAVVLVLALAAPAISPLRAARGVQHDQVAPATVTIGVYGLFHPQELTLTAIDGDALVINAGEERITLERSSGIAKALIVLSLGRVRVSAGRRVLKASRIRVADRQGHAAEFELAVPGKIHRRYRGTIEIRSGHSMLAPIVTMDREDAVAAVVAAESSPDAPLEALKAQAVAARSYLFAARGRHRDFDFCDTTHCQFLREIPAAGSNARKATDATRGLVLAYEAHPFAAMYTRSCSGRTHTPAEVKLPAGEYPYYPAECAYCRAHPARWESRISERDAAALQASDEPSRLRLARRLGWGTVPSNDFVKSEDGQSVRLEGVGQGHGIGLCQAGAKAMAQAGADFRRILEHYYPNARIEQL